MAQDEVCSGCELRVFETQNIRSRAMIIPNRLHGELVALAAIPFATASTVSRAISEDDLWTRVIGPFGGLFLSLLFLAIFLRKDSIARRDRLAAEAKAEAKAEAEEKKREQRHTEILLVHSDNAKTLVGMVEAGIRREVTTEHILQEISESNKKILSTLERNEHHSSVNTGHH